MNGEKPLGDAPPEDVKDIIKQRRARGIPYLSDEWEHYLLCLLFHMALPLFPIALEYWITQQITDKSLTLAASMYAIKIGASSRNRLLFGSAMAASLFYGVAFGMATSQAQALPHSGRFAFWGILAIFLFHGVERYQRHVMEKAPFWEFAR